MKIILALLFFSATAVAQLNQILIDENFEDWSAVQTYILDIEDNLSQGVDFKSLSITNDDNYLFIKIDFFDEIIIQEDTSIVLLINTDNDILTGLQDHNSGAEIKYNFGNHHGYFYHNNDSTEIFQNDIQLISAPTNSSSSYEISFALNSEINNTTVFSSNGHNSQKVLLS